MASAFVAPGSWLRHASITRKLAAIVIVFVAAFVLLVAVIAAALEIANGARAFVGGEGLWSKGQKDAVYYLTRYARSHDGLDYRKYRQAIAVPLSDRTARLELDKPEFDYRVAERGIIEGGNAPQDVPSMIFLYRHFHGFRYLKQAIRIWTEGDTYIAQLVQTADTLRAAVASGHFTPEDQQRMLDRIERINAELTPLEHEFSATLGAGARWIRTMLFKAILLSGVLLLGGGLWVSWWISRDLRADILRLRQGAVRMAQGDLNTQIEVRSRDELGKLAHAFNAMMAHRRKAEKALREATEFRDKVMEKATNSIHACDLEGRFTLVNRRTCEITGYSAAELIGTSYEILIPPAHRADVAEQFRIALGGGKVENHETPLIRKDGSVITVTFSSAPLVKEGQVIGLVGTAEDITERKLAEAERAAHAAELARSNAELEKFAYVAAHDLQEPLRTVTSYAQLLARRYGGKGEKDADEFVAFITGAIQRMRDLIGGLLAYSRVSRRDQDFEAADLNVLLEAALANLKSAIDGCGAGVTHDALPALRVSPQQITQVFQNLVGNAVKFRDRLPPQVHVGAERKDGEWILSVQDNGIGIDLKQQERLFMLFQRLHTRDQYPGSGLGLAICKKIVERHHGRIWMEPATPRGSVFRFALPAE